MFIFSKFIPVMLYICSYLYMCVYMYNPEGFILQFLVRMNLHCLQNRFQFSSVLCAVEVVVKWIWLYFVKVMKFF